MEQKEFTLGDAWALMTEKGITLSDKMKIKNVIYKWSKSFNYDVEHDNKYNVYRNKKVTGYCFDRKEEAIFIGALYDFLPNAKKEKIVEVMSLILKLFDVKSEWSFNGNK